MAQKTINLETLLSVITLSENETITLIDEVMIKGQSDPDTKTAMAIKRLWNRFVNERNLYFQITSVMRGVVLYIDASTSLKDVVNLSIVFPLVNEDADILAFAKVFLRDMAEKMERLVAQNEPGPEIFFQRIKELQEEFNAIQ